MIACVLFLTRYIGVYSYALGLGLSMLITAALNLRLLKKKCTGINYLKYTLHGIMVIIAACLFGWLLNGIISSYLAPIWQILICAPLILGFTLGALYCLEMVSSRPFKSCLQEKLKSNCAQLFFFFKEESGKSFNVKTPFTARKTKNAPNSFLRT